MQPPHASYIGLSSWAVNTASSLLPSAARVMMNFTPCRPRVSFRLHSSTPQMHPIFSSGRLIQASPRPAPLARGDSNVQLTWPRPLTSLPFPSYPFFSIPPSSPFTLTSHPLSSPAAPSTPSCISFSSPYSLSLSLSFSAYPHVSGSEADATQALTYLCLNSPRPWDNGMWLDMRTRHQASGWTGWLDCCTETSQAQAVVSL